MARQARLRGPRLGCVVLAAGGSSRLGRPKQLVRRGMRPLLLDACAAARALAPEDTVVVLGADGLRLRRLLRQRGAAVTVAGNGRWREGMAGSLRLGLSRLSERCAAALVVLCDQREVGPAALERLRRAWLRRPGIPAASRYGGKIGAPAVLPRRLWRALDTVRGDSGARALLRAQDDITIVDLSEAALDLDTPADLQRLRSHRH